MTTESVRRDCTSPSGAAAPEAVTGGKVQKAPTGIQGLDEITQGGLPRNRTTLVAGNAGSGKTVLALQTLVNGARKFGEPGIFVAFEEPPQQIRDNAASFGWNLAELEATQQLVFLNAQLTPDVVTSGGFDLTGLLAAAKAKADEIGAKRIVFDAVDVLLSLLDDPMAERRELLRLNEWLQHSGLCGILTGKHDDAWPLLAQRNSFTQFMVDAVLSLSHSVADRIAMRSLRVVKYRGSCFAENETPIVLGAGGVVVASVSDEEKNFPASTERVSTGVERLDTMLGGGYYRGSSVLITGAPGTSKSTLSCAFIDAACARGERAIYVSFDESASEIVRNSASVGIQLAPHVQSGRLLLHSSRADARSADTQLLKLRALLAEHRPTCLVIDPISALVKGGGELAALTVSEGLLHVTKAQGVTIVCTSLLDERTVDTEASSVQISTLADTWINVSYRVQAGERNRALTVIKSRGTAHSNQVRELVLSHEGITLADVFTGEGEVLMGTMRWLKERQEEDAHERLNTDLARRRSEIELVRAELAAQKAALRHQLEIKEAELAHLEHEEKQRRSGASARRSELMQKRRADAGLAAAAAEQNGAQNKPPAQPRKS